MAMNPMQKKARISFLLGMLLTLLITGAIIAFLIFQLVQIKKKEDAIVYKQVYVANQNIGSGIPLNGNYTIKSIDSTLVPANALTSLNQAEFLTDVSTIKINVEAGTVLTTDMINTDGKAETSDLRLQEYNMIVLPRELAVGDFVDIRLRIPTGENYIVLSKKYIEKTDGETIWIKVGEDEILTMSNAIVEAYIMNGAKLEAVQYTDAGMQNSAIPTYVAKNSVIALMNSDPNITSVAKNALITRYTDDVRRHRDNINQILSAYGDESTSSVENGTKEEIQRQKDARQTYVESLGL